LDAVIIERAPDESRIKTVAVKNRPLVAKLQEDFSMGRGQAEAIALPSMKKAKPLGIGRQEWNPRLQYADRDYRAASIAISS